MKLREYLLQEKWATSVKIDDKTVELFKNPSTSEFLELLNKYPVKQVRGFLFKNGDLVIFDVYTMHDDLLATKGDHKTLLKGDKINVMITKDKAILPYQKDYIRITNHLEVWKKNIERKNPSYKIDTSELGVWR